MRTVIKWIGITIGLLFFFAPFAFFFIVYKLTKNDIMRTCIIIVAIVILSSVLFFSYKGMNGYYPFPSIVRKIYYVNKNEQQRLEPILIDENFDFSRQNYIVEKTITSPYSLPHNLNLTGIIQKKQIETDYEFKGKLKLDIIKNGELIHTETITGASNILKYKNGKPVSTYSFNLTKIPFPLGGKAYDNLKFKVTVIEADPDLAKYVNSTKLMLFPDLVL